MGTCRGWPREGWATMATQLLQLLGRAVNSSCPESAALAGRRGELRPIRHRPAFARAPVGVSTAAGVPPPRNNCTFWQGSAHFWPSAFVPLAKPFRANCGEVTGGRGGGVTSKITVGKYGSDAGSFTGRLLNSHSFLLGPAWGRRAGRTPWLRRYCYSNEAGSWMEPPWPESLHRAQAFSLALFHPKLPGVVQVFVYLWGRKKRPV